MQIPIFKTIILIATCTLSVAAIGQRIYKCADAYSQLPCPDGTVVNAVDQRTNAQKTQTESAVRRDARIADAMEKARLAQEKKDLAANTPPSKAASVEPPKKTAPKQVKKKKKEPEYFTAQVPGAKKKPSNAKKAL
jgi:hypothetical protein